MIHLSQTNAKDFDELVFQDRNQAYGAYVLRREYPKNVLKSLLIGVALIASILAIPYLSNYFRKGKTTNYYPPVTDSIIIIDPPPIKPKVDETENKGGKKPEGNLKKFNTIAIVPEFVEDTMPTNDDFKGFDPSNVNNVGNGPGNFVDGPGEGNDLPTGTNTDSTYGIIFIEQVPEFPGGEKAMYKFLDDNIEYPEYARNIGLEGKVYVSFVVDQFGNLTQINTPRPVGGGLDDEALRVIKMMPRWKPGKMNGRPVKVKYNLPIVFRLH